MPLFAVKPGQELAPVGQTNFPSERELQRLIETSLQSVFKCRFVASEFPTGVQHGGRIDTLALSEDGNPRLKGVLPKDYARPGLDKQRLGELIDVIATIELTAASEGEKTHRSVDLLGRVYEYFLTRFAWPKGKTGGHFYTPSRVVRCLVEMLAPYKGRIYDLWSESL